jgi:AcrR family transcriptional regulator
LLAFSLLAFRPPVPPPVTPRKVPRQERSRLTVEAILDAAARVFERRGYAAGTTNRIAARAGVSIGSLYQYYPNKDAVLVALAGRHLDEGAAALEPVIAGLVRDAPPLADGARRLVEAMVALHAERPALHRVLFEEAPRPPALRRRVEALTERAVAGVAAYLAAAGVRDAEVAARLVVGIVETTTHALAIRPDRGVPAAVVVDETVVLLTGYLEGKRDIGVPPVTPEA